MSLRIEQLDNSMESLSCIEGGKLQKQLKINELCRGIPAGKNPVQHRYENSP